MIIRIKICKLQTAGATFEKSSFLHTRLTLFPKHLYLEASQPKIKVYWVTGPMLVCFPDHPMQIIEYHKFIHNKMYKAALLVINYSNSKWAKMALCMYGIKIYTG